MPVERNTPPFLLSEKELLDLIQKAFGTASSLKEWKVLSGGAVNTTYQFRIEKGTYVLRFYLREKSLCTQERAIHRLIEGKVMTPLLVYADETHLPYPFAIFTYAPGIHLTSVSPAQAEKLSFELGKTLASIHAITFPEAGLFGEDLSIQIAFKKGSSPYFEEAYSILSKHSYARERLGEKQSSALLAFMQRHSAFFPKIDEETCLVHADFKPVNLLYHSGCVNVLDWEFAHAGHPLLDFAILLRYREEFPLSLASLKQGYLEKGGTLPPHWFKMALMTDFVNILTLLEDPAERPLLFERLKKAIAFTQRKWETIQDRSM